ncbi:hypothetical protein HRG_000658 [Hirsutella rhossiliensis]|uniref:tRNA-intron lyase n=1 Tax=Hirsutella rhossiliensis TaxID=111463 RepID=A0A9P8SPA8_9HYPO|nr:putative tRNA-splicing endonuclease subunit tsp-2 [Hirsutella rhossiliensis]KAH0968016.1 putative tRNA-splicing endonuclease subunit tsp-2 [Hirsutella rhossiliensis]
MAEVKTPPQAPGPRGKATHTSPGAKRGPSIHQIYALPAPIRTFPLPTFYPGNPLSLFHVASAWLGQVLSPPPAEPAVIHHGVWSEATTSVHVTDDTSMRALWEQGFYGKGSLSRSEPNWLKRERRRQERAQAKLEEARQEEARRANSTSPLPVPAGPAAPVGPQQILALPNSDAELSATLRLAEPLPADVNGRPILSHGKSISHVANGDSPSRDFANGVAQSPAAVADASDDVLDGRPAEALANGHGQNGGAFKPTEYSESCSNPFEAKSPSRQKSVRFSPKVESTTFQLSDPPSPNQTSASGRSSQQLLGHDCGRPIPGEVPASVPASDADGAPFATEVEHIINQEHLQLTPEEAFFLCFGLGALSISDAESGLPLSTRNMLVRFRQYSYFPPRVGPEEPDLGPDDGFLLHYVVYHHFRSLGWVPRAGIKFGVDWLLYTRGPVFDHAEFGLMIIPSYSDAWWKQHGKRGPRKTWDWLHNSVRVLSHVMKSLVLVYVDVPAPPRFEEALDAGITDALKLYKIREVMVKRWSSNRNR